MLVASTLVPFGVSSYTSPEVKPVLRDASAPGMEFPAAL